MTTVDKLNSDWEVLIAELNEAHAVERAAWAKIITRRAGLSLQSDASVRLEILTRLASAQGEEAHDIHRELQDFDAREDQAQSELLADAYAEWAVAQDRFEEAQDEVVESRVYWRSIGEAVPLGTPGSRDVLRPIVVQNNDGSV